MRRLVVAIFVVAVVFALAGCGGGGSSSSASTSAAPAASTGAAAPVAVGAQATLPELANRSENETTTFAPFPSGPTVPADLNQKINVEKQPTLIYFYDSTQQVSKEVRTIIDAVRNQNRGMVDLVAYDIGKYMKADANGTVSVSEKLVADPTASAAVRLARDPAIGVVFTPFIVLTDSQGYIVYKHRGLIDRAFLEREVLRASR
jgi:ABC-type glycerol-3-phosphate transport system substrate-binding protein